MQSQHLTLVTGVLACVLVVSVVVTGQSQNRFTLKSANGIAFSEFRGYDAWQLIATSQPDNAGGCGSPRSSGCRTATRSPAA